MKPAEGSLKTEWFGILFTVEYLLFAAELSFR